MGSRVQVATGRLLAAISRAEQGGQLVPCVVEPASWWLSEKRTERRRAAMLCRGCPVSRQCAALADVLPATFGVWAGRDRTTMEAALLERMPLRMESRPLPVDEGRRLRELAAAAKDAERRAAAVARRARDRAVAARRARDTALWELSQAGWPPGTLARAAQLSKGQVSTIVARERARSGWQAGGSDEAVGQ